MPKAYELPAAGEPFDPNLFKLGPPCKRNHIHADGMTLRCRHRRKCILCERIDSRTRAALKRATDPEFVRKDRERALHNQRRLRQDPAYRLYQRAAGKAKKVALRGGNPSRLSGAQLWEHWGRFDHRCAYCKCTGDLEIEHVIPICKGGEHHLGNIVPACTRCNSSKRSKDALQWYRTRTYYSELQWQRIQAILSETKPKEN